MHTKTVINVWYCQHISANTNDSKYIRLNLTNAPSNAGSRNTFDTSNITTTQFAVDHNNIVNDNHNHVAYVFAPIRGYSAFFTYEGRANADGTFIYTGFRPARVMMRNLDSAGSWIIFDNKRNPINPAGKRLVADGTYVEDAGTTEACAA